MIEINTQITNEDLSKILNILDNPEDKKYYKENPKYLVHYLIGHYFGTHQYFKEKEMEDERNENK